MVINDFTIIRGVLVKYTGRETQTLIPDGVTSIGGRAFLNCSSLTSIEIPDSVTSIGDFAFDECSSLTSISLPSGIKLEPNSFAQGTSLKDIIYRD